MDLITRKSFPILCPPNWSSNFCYYQLSLFHFFVKYIIYCILDIYIHIYIYLIKSFKKTVLNPPFIKTIFLWNASLSIGGNYFDSNEKKTFIPWTTLTIQANTQPFATVIQKEKVLHSNNKINYSQCTSPRHKLTPNSSSNLHELHTYIITFPKCKTQFPICLTYTEI